MFALIGGDVRHGGGAGRRRPAVPRAAAEPARRAAARGVRPLPRGRRRPLGPRRAAGRIRRRPPRPGAVRAVGDDLGPSPNRAARALVPPAAPHLPPRGCDRHLRTPRQRLRARQGRARAGLRGAAERRRRVLVGGCAPGSPCAVPGHVCRPIGAGKGGRGAPSGLVFLRLVSTSSRAGSGRRRSDPSPGRRHRRGRARGAGGSAGAAQLLRGLRRCGHTVHPHARLPRAVGAGRQRSLQPGSPRDRDRRGRRRRRRADRARAHRPGRPRRRPGRPRRRAAPAARRPRPARPAWGPPGAPRCVPTRTPTGPPGWPRALAAAGAGRPKDGC